MKELLEVIAKNLVDIPEQVSVTEKKDDKGIVLGNIAEVNRLLKQFEEMKKMMKQMNALTKGKKGKFKFPFR